MDSLLQKIRAREDELENQLANTGVPAEVSNKINITDLRQLRRDALTPRTFIVERSITEVDTNRGWFYYACPKCSRPAIKKKQQWACPSHGRYDVRRPVYRLNRNPCR